MHPSVHLLFITFWFHTLPLVHIHTFLILSLRSFSSRNHNFCLFTLTLSSVFPFFCLGSVLYADWLAVLLLTVAHIPDKCIKARSVLELPLTAFKVKSQFYTSVKTSARSLLPKSTSFKSRGFVNSLCSMLMHIMFEPMDFNDFSSHLDCEIKVFNYRFFLKKLLTVKYFLGLENMHLKFPAIYIGAFLLATYS